MSLTYDILKEKLTAKFGEQVGYDEQYDMLNVTVPAEMNWKLLQFLYDEEDLKYRFLTDLTGAHFPERVGEELNVIYHLHNLEDNIRLRVKIYVPVEKPDVFTTTKLFAGANWMERETYDFFGINFIGHPNLKRILNADEMDYFPMRKEYTMEDPQRTDKDDEMFGR